MQARSNSFPASCVNFSACSFSSGTIGAGRSIPCFTASCLTSMAAFLMIFDHALAEWLDLGAFRPISRHPSERDLCLLGAGYLRQKVLLLRSLSKSAATA